MGEKQVELNVIYGRAGTGKSEFLYRDIAKKIADFKSIFVIVPEQSNLTSERKFFEITGQNAMLNVEVLTLSRMAMRVEEEVGEKTEVLSKIGKSMLIYDLLSKERKNLNFLGKSEKNVETVQTLLTELKKHNVTIEDLKSLKLDEKYTAFKVADIELLYQKYEEYLSGRFIDENDELTILSQKIAESNMFDNAAIYFDDFFGFTPQEYRIFEELLKKVKQMTVAICLDKIESNKPKEQDIFYFNRKFAKKILEIADRQGCIINLYAQETSYRFQNPELKLLEKSLCGWQEKSEKVPQNVSLFLASNPYSEMEHVAQKIYELVKKDGYQYKEIGLVASDIESYAEDAKVIFEKYDIPLFIDEKKDLNQNLLIQFILGLLAVLDENWSYDAVFNYLKIGLLDLEYDEICFLENYCKKWGIRGAKWLKSWNYEPLNEKQEMLEKLRQKITEPVFQLKQNFIENKTVSELTKNIYQFLIENHILENLDRKVRACEDIEIVNQYNASYKILIGVLDSLVDLFGEDKVSFEKYKELLKAGIDYSELGKIPATQDQVVLGDSDRTRNNSIKILFVLGVNDGLFPKVNKQEGFFSDNDRTILENARN